MKVTDRLVFLMGALLLCCSASLGAPAPGGRAPRPLRWVPPALGKSCVSNDPGFLCLGLKYVVYSDRSEKPVIGTKTVESNLEGINSIWNQCRIGFQVDEFVAASPKKLGLPDQTTNFSDLDVIRRTFNADSELLVVTTYKWKRDGSLGRTPANAWTKMPGSGTYGVVLEQKVGNFPNIIAHELGHYLNLYHVSERSEVMNAIIYNGSKAIPKSQCEVARSAVRQYWSGMLRRAPSSRAQPQLAGNGQPVTEHTPHSEGS